jgi:hypothetical protein
MGILDSIKDRIYGRKDEDLGDLDDIKSYASGDQYNEQFKNMYPEKQKQWEGPETAEPEALQTDRRELSFDNPAKRNDVEREYDIADRLKIIESQLQAIRSQTETINERLKNMEMHMGRRF